jgi:hypothetical protein
LGVFQFVLQISSYWDFEFLQATLREVLNHDGATIEAVFGYDRALFWLFLQFKWDWEILGVVVTIA